MFAYHQFHNIYTIDKNDLPYDKMYKKRGLINNICNTYKKDWNLDQFITVGEIIVRYKGKYCPVRQYMPKKPIKVDLKSGARLMLIQSVCMILMCIVEKLCNL